ncbi:hypothetical protein LCGC14_1311480 [marine sediment metagenome]|uniref:Uncharacterized protein n=1 Tax=marine sediment metagenome TaxID=412755 RepID=A0A0F9L7A7_9ZZZZ
MTTYETHLKIETVQGDLDDFGDLSGLECDGCGKPHKRGDTVVSMINSCCGKGEHFNKLCGRVLCKNCVLWAFLRLFKKAIKI